MTIDVFTVGMLDTNCYLLCSESTGKSILVDPGGITDRLMDEVRATDLTAILLTHGHFDHIGGVDEIVAATGAPVMIHANDADFLNDTMLNGSGLMGQRVTAQGPDRLLTDGDTIEFGDSAVTVMHTPGHTSGGVSLVCGDKLVLAGDTLFRMAIGRWDLAGGDYQTLIGSLDRFRGLPDDMAVYPGHGGASTIGFEKANNQYLNL